MPSIFKSLQIVMYDFISSIQNGHFLVPLTGPFRMKTAGVFALASLASRALQIHKILTMLCDVEQTIIKDGEDAFEILVKAGPRTG